LAGLRRMTKLLQGVVFDMDGVIVDSHPAHRLAWKEFLRSLGKDVADDELDFIMDGRKREDILVHFLGPLDPDQLHEYGKRKNDLFCRVASKAAPIPGVLEFIEWLDRENIPLAVATSASRNRTQFTLRSMGLLNRFRAIVTGDEVSQGKPHPAIYQLACERIHCLPDTTLAFEDAASGVRSAKSAGLRCIGVTGHQAAAALIAAGADAVVPDFVALTFRDFHALVSVLAASSLAR
jgi:beta-phosphoglucomutase